MTEKITSSSDIAADDSGFAVRLLRAMEEAKHSRRSLADAINVHHNLVGNWAKGSYLPNAQHLVPLAQKLDVSIDWLLTGEETLRTPTTQRQTSAAVGLTEELARLAPALEHLTKRARKIAQKSP
ncbi:MAG TPA: helix-turn-helix domain-containing protein [Solirubrobacteraceae bacterium]|jgi:transcriptional regulator with XRE-family HTH domain|nr:helix-turn-helix domain-containing protein [Solirubrobacteraceae bacterium]HXB15412.1 helix-turn-helix domain-containing protein [Solirubrobacteraceae bacterium]